ncbi:ABC transporter ATP-binding protein [Mucilaginibacter myungsuensis]|uniref:ATP-binding cassette domain-containing protein n=1 Tax=Mucilaginibacter myungsuensis TaxID=649104 RepID=A0A929KZH7_9SPHI|nr:ATP-binding cassette domain-containing protein [Mucilaginibacter myungsuensis]MBE9662813.1 ATP-binding cassette domain-containing protein [Mucilaginibacter myungsuensis]MDN3598233.1 ATP-binding cassette domain-containing protein [Mucilaginibacter myungsuensis]
MIRLTDISKTFNKGQPNEVMAIDALDLTIAAGEYLVIVGSNGSGKSTLLNLVAGSILPTSGTINFDGEDVTRLPDHRRSKWIARVFQNPLSGTAPDLSIIDNFRLAALRTGHKGLRIGVNDVFKARVREKIATLNMGLEIKTGQLMGSLSGGQRQALTLLMSVMDDCNILLLDEPSAALDPRSADIVMRTADSLIKQFNLTAMLVTHNLKDAYTYGNRIIQMSEGKVLHDLSAEQKAGLMQNDLFGWFS